MSGSAARTGASQIAGSADPKSKEITEIAVLRFKFAIGEDYRHQECFGRDSLLELAEPYISRQVVQRRSLSQC